jgi:Tol biopolymer transport system component
MSSFVNRSQVIVLSLTAVMAGACDSERPDPDVNQPPVIGMPAVITDEDTPVQIPVLEGASDPEGETLAVAEVSASGNAPAHTIEVLTGGILRLTPASNFHGMIAVTYKISDRTHAVPGMAIVTVRPVNDAPVAVGASKGVHRATPITLVGSDVDGDALAFELVGAPAHGAITGEPPAIQYAPETGYTGADEIRFRVRDGAAASEPAVVQLQVRPNVAPAATAASVAIAEDGAIGLVLQGSDADGDPITFAIETAPQHGTLSGTAPNLTYTPAANFHGDDAIVFSVSDGELSTTGTFAIAVSPVNDPPTATPRTADATEDTGSTIALAGSDVDGDTLTFQLATAPSHGTVVIAGSSATYTPAENYHGPDSFAFRAVDGVTASAPATVEITVAPVNDAPVAAAIARTFDEDASTAVALAGSDVDGDALSFAVVTGPEHGTLSGTPPQLTYTPAANYNGPDSFTYTASDAGTTSAAATVTLTVRPVNDLPTASDLAVSTDEDAQVAIALQGNDIDGEQPSFVIVTLPADGTLSGNDANRTYTPSLNANGTRTITFRACDAVACGTNATVTIAIRPVNDAPQTAVDFVATDPGAPLTFAVTGNDSDVDGDTVTLDAVDAPAHGDIEIVDGQLVYTPDADFAGTDLVVYTVIDGKGGSATGNARIGVGEFPPGAPAEVVVTSGTPPSEFAARMPAISSNGRYLAFSSRLALISADTNNLDDIYLFDRATRQLRRVSVAIGGGQGNGPSLHPHLSGDGRYVVFNSAANNLVAGDTNLGSDVFRHDRVTGETIRVSVATGGGQGSGLSFDAEISEDGNLVVFTSGSFELVPDDVNGADDVFVRDIAAGTTTRASVGADGGDGELGSSDAAISGDGRFVAFTSRSSNLVPGDTNEFEDIFVRDRLAGTTTRVSVSSNGGEGDGESSRSSLSRDGRFVSFLSSSDNLVPGVNGFSTLFVRDVVGTTTTFGGADSLSSARLSGDGRYAIFFNFDGVFIRDRLAAVSRFLTGSRNWQFPMLSGNGRYIVAFDSSNGGRIVVLPNPL